MQVLRVQVLSAARPYWPDLPQSSRLHSGELAFLHHCKLPRTHENTKHTVDAHLCGRVALSRAI